MIRKKRAGRTGHGCALVAVLGALIAPPNPAAAQGPNQAALSGNVGAWNVDVWVNDGEVTYGLTRRSNGLSGHRLRFSCFGEEGWQWAASTNTDYGWPRQENVRSGTVWMSLDGHDLRWDDRLIDTYGGVLRGFAMFRDPDPSDPAANLIFTSRTVSFRLEGDSATMTFDLAGLQDAHRLAYTVTGLCRPSEPPPG